MATDNFFLCPNGHRINWSETLAGRDAKCPRCGILLRIPSANGATAQALSGAAAATVAPVATAAQQPAASSSGEQNNMAFLCPNGHRLVGPARLQGQAGQCPHCGARFLVPMLNEMERVEEVDLTDLPAEDDLPLQSVDDVPPPAGGVHPLCKLLRKLWPERERGAVIELHLEGGMMLVPDWFDDKLSRHSHGLFAAQAADPVACSGVAHTADCRLPRAKSAVDRLSDHCRSVERCLSVCLGQVARASQDRTQGVAVENGRGLHRRMRQRDNSGGALWWITPFRRWQATLVAAAIVAMGFLGGLVMSAVKRDRGVKDWGHAIAGHGGILDRVGSIIFSAPLFFYFLRAWPMN